MIVITHEMGVIESICDRVAIIDKSHIAEVGGCPTSSPAPNPPSAGS